LRIVSERASRNSRGAGTDTAALPVSIARVGKNAITSPHYLVRRACSSRETGQRLSAQVSLYTHAPRMVPKGASIKPTAVVASNSVFGSTPMGMELSTVIR